MNRQLKFREWLGKEFHYWGFMEDGSFILPTNIKGPQQQTTGLLDKNEKEIYEGDIVKYILSDVMPEDEGTEYTEQVLFNEGVFSVDGLTPLYVAVEWSCEVIGNVFENPDLLK